MGVAVLWWNLIYKDLARGLQFAGPWCKGATAQILSGSREEREGSLQGGPGCFHLSLFFMLLFRKRVTDKIWILEDGRFCKAVGFLIQRHLTECMWPYLGGESMRGRGWHGLLGIKIMWHRSAGKRLYGQRQYPRNSANCFLSSLTCTKSSSWILSLINVQWHLIFTETDTVPLTSEAFSFRNAHASNRLLVRLLNDQRRMDTSLKELILKRWLLFVLPM